MGYSDSAEDSVDEEFFLDIDMPIQQNLNLRNEIERRPAHPKKEEAFSETIIQSEPKKSLFFLLENPNQSETPFIRTTSMPQVITDWRNRKVHLNTQFKNKRKQAIKRKTNKTLTKTINKHRL